MDDTILNHSKVELADRNKCGLCHHHTIAFNPKLPNYFCQPCFKLIESLGGVGSKWADFFVNQENSRRKRRDRLMKQHIPFHTVPFSALSLWEAERLGVD